MKGKKTFGAEVVKPIYLTYVIVGFAFFSASNLHYFFNTTFFEKSLG